jgi:RNA polymerase sigma-70 factor (ECF subfamily)
MQNVLQEIIRAVKDGNKHAFRKLVEEFQERAFRLAFRMLGDEEDARDVVQDSFIKMWQNIHTYRENENFIGWMNRIVSNTAIDRMRARKRNPVLRLDDLHRELRYWSDDGAHHKLENKEAGLLIRALTDDLSEKQRIIFSLRDLEGLSAEEVEAITGFSEDSIKSNLYHARKSIKERLLAIFTYERRNP